MKIEFQKCGEEHLDTLVEISKATFIAAFKDQNNPDDFDRYISQAFSRQRLYTELMNPESVFYFVFGKGELVGYFKLNTNDAQTDIKLPESMELERIYVLHNFQGNGLGEMIVEKAKKMAKDLKKSFLWLGVWEKNQRAIQFYERQDFYQFGTHPYYIGDDKQTDWLMRADL